MPDEINFMDLASLLSLGPDTTLEKLGSAINANFFDASNIAGSLKQKGLIDFAASYPGPNTVNITDIGKELIAEADAKVASPYDDLDDAILMQVSGGKRLPIELQNTLNIRPKDLALRIYKLYKQGYLTYDLKSGGVVVLLTDAGFLKSKAATNAAAQIQPAQNAAATQQEVAPTQDKETEIKEMPKLYGKPHKLLYVVIVLLVLLAAGAYYFLVIK